MSPPISDRIEDCLHHSRGRKLSGPRNYIDEASEHWGLSFIRRADDSLAAELAGPRIEGLPIRRPAAIDARPAIGSPAQNGTPAWRFKSAYV